MILQCIIVLQSKSIDFTDAFAHAYIPIRVPVFIEVPRDLKSDGGKCDVVIILKKILYGKYEAARLWYEMFRNVLLERVFVTSKVDT